jgi:hypothetical protein
LLRYLDQPLLIQFIIIANRLDWTMTPRTQTALGLGLLLVTSGITGAWSPTRRALFRQSAVALVATLPTAPAGAKDEIFRPNPLTNRVLEQIRIWEQAEADNLKYGGELESGRPNDSPYAELLVPILGISAELESVDRIVRSYGDRTSILQESQQIVQQSKYDKVAFKKAFNAYGDNIYYTDPDRANAYLGGGATPKTEQTLAYLMRNEILTNVEDMRAEIDFLLKNIDEPLEELQKLSLQAAIAMRKYLEVVPPAEIVEARNLLKKRAS